MAAGIGVLGPECRAEGIDPAQGQGIDFRLQLTGNGQAGPTAEKIISVGRLAFKLLRLKRGHGKHFTRPLAVGSGDDRGVNLVETVSDKKIMDPEIQDTADPGNSSQGIGPRPEVGY